MSGMGPGIYIWSKVIDLNEYLSASDESFPVESFIAMRVDLIP